MSLARAKNSFRTFHRRDSNKQWREDWLPPATLYCLGRGLTLYYSSDKADPDDPLDNAGTWRGYYHDHEEPDTMVYAPKADALELLGYLPSKTITPRWPEVLGWLGSADGLDLEIEGQELTLDLDGSRNMKGMQLWQFPSGNYLVAVEAHPKQNSSCIVWHGKGLTVGWAGIDG